MKIRMIDVSGKDVVERRATASGRIMLGRETINRIRENKTGKGDPLTVAEISAINAVKKTPDVIPLCHQIPVDKVDVEYTVDDDSVTVTVTVKAKAKTGVEMEALAGVSAALLVIWDMVKMYEKDAGGQYPSTWITDIKVVEKHKENV